MTPQARRLMRLGASSDSRQASVIIDGRAASIDTSRMPRDAQGRFTFAIPTSSGSCWIMHGEHQLWICCEGGGSGCIPLPIAWPSPSAPSSSMPRAATSLPSARANGCHAETFGPNNVLHICCPSPKGDICIPIPIVFGPLPGDASPRHRPIFRTAPGRGELVLTARGKRYVVNARPSRHPVGGGGHFSFGPRGPQRIAPGTCDEYEGDSGHMYICCKSHDGGHVDCYRIIHQDPWNPS